MKTLLSLLLLCGLVLPGSAQLETHIPQDVAFVLTWNPKNLDKKVPLNKVQEMQMWEMGVSQLAAEMAPENEELMYQFLNSPSEFGIDGMGSIYVVGKMDAAANLQTAMLFNITDQNKLVDFLRKVSPVELTPESKGTYQLWNMGDGTAFAYNQNTGIFGNIQQDDSEVLEAYDFELDPGAKAEEDEMVVVEEADATPWLDELMRTTSNNLINNAQYRRTKETTYDMGFYMDYAYINTLQGMNNTGLAGVSQMAPLLELMNGMYEGTFLGGGLNFLPGKIQMDVKYYSTPRMERFFEASTEHKFKKKLVRYVKGDELMGFYHFNFDMEDTVDGIKDIYKGVAREVPEYGDAAATALEILGLFIDEEQIYELFPGQMMVALTGLETVERMQTVTEYDDEFNPVEVEKMVSEPMPQFTAVVQTADERNLRKFMRLGRELGVMEDKGTYFRAVSDELPVDMYLAIVKDAVVITTDVDLMQNRLRTGYKGDLAVSKEQLNTLKNTSSLLYLDVDKMVKVGMENAGSDMAMAMMGIGMVSDKFKSVQISSPADQENGFLTSFVIEMTDEKTNALEQLLELLNMGASMMMGGGRT